MSDLLSNTTPNSQRLPHLVQNGEGRVIVTLSLAFILFIYLGIVIGSSDYFVLAPVFAIVALLAYSLLLSKHWLILCFLYTCLSFNIRPVGFAVSPLHVALALSTICLASNIWRKIPKRRVEQSPIFSFRAFEIIFWVYIIYMVLNAFIHLFYPHGVFPVAMKTMAKQYADMVGGFALIWLTIRFYQYFKVPDKLGKWIAYSLLFGLIINIIIRGYGIIVLGLGSADTNTIESESAGISTFFIPVINLTDNRYALRTLGPLAMTFAITFLFTNRAKTILTVPNSVAVVLLLLGLLGSLMSFGRGALLIGFGLSAVILLARKQIMPVIVVMLLGILALAGARSLYDIDKNILPMGVTRSMAMIPGMDMPEAEASIQSSTNWRLDVALSAWDEWKSDWRVILIGRGVYAFTEADIQAILLNGARGTLETSQRRGHTHNATTDLLLVTGIFGYLLYWMVMLALIHDLIKLRARLPEAMGDARTLLLFTIACLSFFIPVTMIGGGWISLYITLIVAMIIVHAFGNQYLSPGSEAASDSRNI